MGIHANRLLVAGGRSLEVFSGHQQPAIGYSTVHFAVVPAEAVEQLRAQLRDRGYLTHGIERWFALDPWSSRAFWTELAVVAAKAAALIAVFAALPPVAVMLARNHPLSAAETLLMTLLYGAAS